MAQSKMRRVDEMAPGRSFWYYVDCAEIIPGATGSQLFNKVVANTAVGPSLLDKHGGQWKVDCGNASPAANDMAAIFTLAKMFEFGNGKSGTVRVRLDLAEANTNKMMLFMGFTSVVTAAMIADTTGQPIGTFDGCGIYKPISQLFWSMVNSVGTTQNKKDSQGTCEQANAGSSTTQDIEVSYECLDSTTAVFSAKINGKDLLGTAGNILTQTFTYTGAGAMAFYLGCKLGSTTRETFTIHKISMGGAD